MYLTNPLVRKYMEEIVDSLLFHRFGSNISSKKLVGQLCLIMVFYKYTFLLPLFFDAAHVL
jgi:hypothetical protein